jgi:hypothetical protein
MEFSVALLLREESDASLSSLSLESANYAQIKIVLLLLFNTEKGENIVLV